MLKRVLAGALLGVAVLVPATAWADSPAVPVVPIAEASSQPAGSPGEGFLAKSAIIYMGARSAPYLSGRDNADAPIYVDDVLEISVCNPDSKLCPVVHREDFSENCTAAGPKPIPPLFIGGFLHSGMNQVVFTLRDLCGQNRGSSGLYLSGAGVITGNETPPDDCAGNPLKYFGGAMLSPIVDQSVTDPGVGDDHKVHGTGLATVNQKLNCSAQVQMRLETRVCNRFGYLCNPKTIATTGWESLPSSGIVSRDLTGDCRSGVDSYRVQVQVLWATWDGFVDGTVVPEMSTHSEAVQADGDAGWVKLKC
ncbi:hypothetical protein [Paractinoplanes lichenicola]|uniref:Uncharacterized protein n=1 Tax=Paractinoplanes lichenicola TaxID=2802976 RepID=A0ABS1VLJ7_9ACTN|nr:hypothetical protein [Actinoplanes lichenicola]MBL7255602.1 hypothetical protein [Actinoplanes lichenicola]